MDKPSDNGPAMNELLPKKELPAVISREDLYALVWSEPMSRLSTRFGLSDVALAKACTRMMIPVPGRGYWAKKDVGRAPRPTRLPMLPASAGKDKRELRVRRRDAPSATEASRDEPAAILVVVPELLTQPHPLVAKTVKAFRGGRSVSEGFLSPKIPECLTVKATMATIDRAMRIFDAVIKAIEERGYVVEIQKYNRQGYQAPFYRTVVLLDGEAVEIELTESTKRTEHVRTGPNDYSAKYEFVASGRLGIGIRNEYGRRAYWSDGAKQTVESQLGKFIHGLAVAALELKDIRRKREEYALQESERQHREQEEAERRRAEAGRIRALDKDIDRMHSARWAREYLMKLNEKLTADPDANTAEMQRWVAWVEAYANRIDPFLPHARVPKDPNPYG